MFAAGVTSVSFDVNIADDNIIETNENLTLTIAVNSLPRKVATSVTAAQTVLTIIDNDSKCLYCRKLKWINTITICIHIARTESIPFEHNKHLEL